MSSSLEFAEASERCRFIRKPPLDCRVPASRRLPRITAVTIGIGFRCMDGFVLCADNQIT
jgi:hypothetical protein